VDLHHIIPWREGQEHSFENLIALCPTCHRRAHLGEIDRKALGLYKSRLDALWKREGIRADEVVTGEWVTKTFSESGCRPGLYEAVVEYPWFPSSSKDFEELNLIEQARVIRRLADFRGSLLGHEPFLVDGVEYTSTVWGSFAILTFSKFLLSIRYSFTANSAGAAHPYHWTEVANYQLDPLIYLSLPEVLNLNQECLTVISKQCIEQVSTAMGQPQPSTWLLEGASPAPEHFSKFNLVPEGLAIVFDHYEVGGYAEGGHRVVVPAGLIHRWLRPGSVAGFLWSP